MPGEDWEGDKGRRVWWAEPDLEWLAIKCIKIPGFFLFDIFSLSLPSSRFILKISLLRNYIDRVIKKT